MKNFLKIAAALALTVSLAGCLGLGDDTASSSLTHTLADTEKGFEIQYPETFIEVPASDLPSGAYAGLVDLESPADFTVNVTVAGEQLTEPVSSLRYALANIAKNEKTLPGYAERQVQDLQISSNPTKMVLFAIDRGGVKTNFIQAFATDRDRGYVVTAIYPADSSQDKEKLLTEMVQSFDIPAPAK